MSIWEQWNAIPAQVREPIRSAVVASALVIQTSFWLLLFQAIKAGQIDSPVHTAIFFWNNGWGVAFGIVLPALYRASQARVAVRNTVPLPNGGSAVLIPPPSQKGT